MQDIQFALAYQNPLRLTFSPFEEKLRQAWESRPILNEQYWTHRAVWLLAETINFCYNTESDDNQLNVIDGEALREKICAWEAGRPEGFQPLHFSPADPRNGRPFPVVWYTSPWHGTWHSINGRTSLNDFGANREGDIWANALSWVATAVQHICMAKALIREHDLRVMSLGPESERWVRRTKVWLMYLLESFMLGTIVPWATFPFSMRMHADDRTFIGRNHGKPEYCVRHCVVGR